MTRIRLVQETAASSTTVTTPMGNVVNKYCENSINTPCGVLGFNPGECPGAAPQVCSAKPPKGGEVILFGCGANSDALERTQYYWFVDTFQCVANCFSNAPSPTNVENASDNLIACYTCSEGLKEPYRQKYNLDAKIKIYDIKISSTPNLFFTCASNPSPWAGCPPGTPSLPPASAVPNPFPLQATIQYTSQFGDQFVSAVGRTLILTNNVSKKSPTVLGSCVPSGNDWSKVEIMIGLKKRATDCRVITVTNTNIITDTNDADCAF
jgi:hypothetical protein